MLKLWWYIKLFNGYAYKNMIIFPKKQTLLNFQVIFLNQNTQYDIDAPNVRLQ